MEDSKMKKILILVLLVIIAGTLLSQKRYYKGNTHTHSYPKSSDADAAWTPEYSIALYKSKGYDFLVFTDHGAYWYASGYSTPDFTVISGSEAGLSGGYRGHFTAMKITSNISGSGKTFQQLIDAITAQGGVPFLNHPRWATIPLSALQIINEMKTNLFHVEVYNGVTDTPTSYDTSLWDSVLTTGRKFFGVASDDAHKESHQGKGWICIYAYSNHPDTIVNAIHRGDFYASNGIVLDTVGYAYDRIYIKSANGSTIKFIGSGGKILQTNNGNEATYFVKGDEGYVRAQISNAQNQTAWIQPMMLPNPTESDTKESSIPESPILFQNYPNPFNPTTAISYQLSVHSFVDLRIFDVLGKEVTTLTNEEKLKGRYTTTWEANDKPSGVYYCRLMAGEFVQTRRMVLVR
jgi:hypothetical protein